MLKDLPESVAAKELDKSSSTIILPGNSVYDRNDTMLKFEQRQLAYAKLSYSWGGLKIGSDPNGPFFKFPLTREQIVELFGEPLEWKRAPKPPSWP